jgi:hypothetical protein
MRSQSLSHPVKTIARRSHQPLIPWSNSQSSSQNYVPDYQSSQVIPEVTSKQTSPAIDRDIQQIASQQKAKDQEEITKTATEWLKKLDPLGGEGLWFEEFAKNYPSRLEAAIALLQSK